MSEIEVPTEHLHEHMEHAAKHGAHDWVSWVALSSALLAVLAAVAALLAGHHVDEAMLLRMQASDQWSYYQAKSIKGHCAAQKSEILSALGRKAEGGEDAAKRYEEEKKEIQEKAEEF